MIRFNHFADVHFRPSKALDVFASIDVIERESDGIDFNIAAGDLWDYPVQNTGASQFPEYVARISRIAEKAPLVMVQGTPTHDSDGSLDIFEQASKHITVLKMGKGYFVNKFKGVYDYVPGHKTEKGDLALIFGLPEPQKKHLIAYDTSITMDDAIRAVLFGYAAVRAKYPELPCILVYHGQVKGAINPNGETVEGGVSIDDIALVGADYIAMGDIHRPQRVGISRGLHAYYPGAIHPTGDWKDAGYQFGMNQVSIENLNEIKRDPEISRILFPHPELVKFETKFGQQLPNVKENTRVWWEITATKEESVTIDTESLLKDLITSGADSKSKVTIKVKADETVRAGEITSLRKFRDKFTLWMKNTGKEASPSMLEKCDTIEAIASGKGLTTQGGSFSFDKLILRGSKGIWKKQRKDEITLDLTSRDPGIIGLIGPNGRGKSTIINNFHVWPEMPNMGGPLYKQFRLKDSLREVYATDHTTGIKYRSRMKINAPGKTVEYFLDQKTGDEWTSYPGITGRLADYESVINSLFGSLSLYIRTAMQLQSPTSDYPDIAKATKGEKKTVMSALAGIDFYNFYKAEAKVKGDTLEKNIADIDVKISTMKDGLKDRETLISDIKIAETAVKTIEGELPGKEAEGKIIGDRVKALEQTSASQNVIKAQIEDLKASISKDEASKSDSLAALKSIEISVSTLPENVTIVNKYELLKTREAEINAEKTAYLEESARLSHEYLTKKEAHDKEVKEIEAERTAENDKYRNGHNNLVSTLAMIDRDIERYMADLAKPITDHCPTCAQLLPADAIEHVKKERETIVEKLETLKANRDSTSAQIAQLDKEHERIIAAIEERLSFIDDVKPVERKPFDETKLNEVKAELLTIDIASARKVVQEANGASIRMDSLNEKIREIEMRIKNATVKLEELKPLIDETLQSRIEEANTALNTARSEYRTLTDKLATEKANLKHAKDALIDLESKENEIKLLENDRYIALRELADWRLIEQGSGQNGIQALELDALSPTIASVATELLKEYEDGRFSIRFDTTREGNKGNQIEDFIIWVIDSRDGDEQEFETLSGGESAWVRYALMSAFSIVRGNNSGVKYLTGFLDESDSSLFPESRVSYFRMLESSFRQSGKIHTIVVTHSPELQEMISQKIDVTELGSEESK